MSDLISHDSATHRGAHDGSASNDGAVHDGAIHGANHDGADILPVPEERGRLVVRDAVVETVARRAAAAVSATQRATGLTRLVGSDLPHVEVSVHGEHVQAELTVAAQWPTPVGPLAERVREAVIRDIGRYTGLTVTRVQVEVRCITRDDTTPRRVR